MTDFDIASLDLSTSAEKSSLREFVACWEHHSWPVLFAGAGLSKFNAKPKQNIPSHSKFGSWDDLLNDVRDRLADNDPEVRKQLAIDPLRLAQVFEQHFGRAALLDLVAKHIPNDDFVPGEAHDKLSAIRWSAIVTTNYDDLIERSLRYRRTVRKIVDDSDLTQRRTLEDLFVVKLHGDLSRRETIVLTEDDYRGYPSNRPGLSLKVRQLLIEHPLLFVGFSLTDPHFSMIDGWIRDTVRNLRLPAIAVIHPPSLPAERAMWQKRGITTVQLGSRSRLGHLFLALANERARRIAIGGHSASSEIIWELQRQAADIASGDDSRRVTLLADKLRAIVRQAGGPDARNQQAVDAIRWFAHGWHNVLHRPYAANERNESKRSDITAADVYEQLTSDERRELLFLVLEAGVDQLRLSPSETVDVLAQLGTADIILTHDEAARAHLSKARIQHEMSDMAAARESIREARAVCESISLRNAIAEEMREILFQEGDAAKISEELQHPLEGGIDIFAMCRRGADHLLLGQRDAAQRWYSQALERASNGDERYAALWGVYACTYEPFASSRNEDARNREKWFREELRAIPAEERPRAEKALEMIEEAGRRALDDRHKELAAQKLLEFLCEARHMGWPHTAHHVSYITDTSARRAAQLLVALPRGERSDEQGDGAKDGIPLLIRYGLAGNTREIFTSLVCERLGRNPEDIQWFRRFANVRPTLPQPADAHLTAMLRGIALLDDDAITKGIALVVERATAWLSGKERVGTDVLTTWMELVDEADEHLPHRAALDAFQLLIQCVGDHSAMIRFRPNFQLELWRDQGFLKAGDSSCRALGAALARAVPFATSSGDQRWVRALASVAISAADAGLLDTSATASILAEFGGTLSKLLQQSPFDKSDVITLADTIDSLDKNAAKSSLTPVGLHVLQLVKANRRSGAFSLTLDLASRLVHCVPDAVRAELLKLALQYAEDVFARDSRFDAVSALSRLFEALAKKNPRKKREIVGVLARIAQCHTGALRSYSILGGPSVTPDVVENAMKALLSARSRIRVLTDIADWLRARPDGDLSNILEMSVGLLASESRDVRLSAISAVRAYVIASSGAINDWRFRTISAVAESDPSYTVRAMALDTLRRAKLTSQQELVCHELAAHAGASQIAIERRLGTLLAAVSGTSRRRNLRRATPTRTRR